MYNTPRWAGNLLEVSRWRCTSVCSLLSASNVKFENKREIDILVGEYSQNAFVVTISSPDNAAADTPPLVDSPPLPDMNGDATTTDPVNDTVHPGESGLLGDRPGASHNMAPGRTSSVVQKSNESAMSRAIRKANESYLKSQPPTTDSIKSSKCSQSQKLENGSAKEQPSHGHEAGPDAEQISIGGDESPGRDVIEGESQLDLNVDLEEKGGDESTLNSPKAEVKPANSGRSDSSSSSDSSDSDSDSGDSSDSHSASRYATGTLLIQQVWFEAFVISHL